MSGDITLTSPSGKSTVRISTHGATVLSWIVNSNERIFLSKLANADHPVSGKGIRGGIPVVFPNFGPWDLGPQHGFARGKQWTIASQTASCAVLVLVNDAETERIWNHKFELRYY